LNVSNPVSKYPRQPAGPSGFGGSGVRRAQSTGGQYQRTRPDVNTLSIQSGDFSRVVVSGDPEYIANSFFFDKQMETQDYRMVFKKSAFVKEGILAAGPNGIYFTETIGDFSISTHSHTYEVRPGVTENVTFDRETTPIQLVYDGYKKKPRTTASYTDFYTYLPLTSGNTMYFRNGDKLAYWGNHPVFDRSIAVESVGNFGRVDSVGRPLADPSLVRGHENSPTNALEEYRINATTFTRANAEFMWLVPLIVLKDFTVLILAETFFRPGVWNGTDDIRPKLWAVVTPNNGAFGTFTYTDLTASVFSGGRIPNALNDAGTLWFGTLTGRPYQYDLSRTMHTMILGATGDNEFSMAFQQRMPTGWRTRVAHVSVAGGTATGSIVHEDADTATFALSKFWQNITHLGNGVVLAKITDGAPGINKAVEFRKSMDRGLTWDAPFVPTGFDAPMLNQYFGDLRAHKAITPENTGRVLIPSWSPADSKYHVYASDDAGSTWEKKAKIYASETFARIDSMEFGDGGGNFQLLNPGPSWGKTIDVTLPDRYKDR
jgi:hypothetical protein